MWVWLRYFTFVVEVVLWLPSDVSCMLHIWLLTTGHGFAIRLRVITFGVCVRDLLCLWCFRLIIVRVTCNLLLVLVDCVTVVKLDSGLVYAIICIGGCCDVLLCLRCTW